MIHALPAPVSLAAGSQLARHQANVAANLTHRIEVARAEHNDALLALLEQEQAELLSTWQTPAPTSWRQRLRQSWQTWRWFSQNRLALRVERVQDAAGQRWWYAFDPNSGKTLYADSETDVLRWIEENQLGS